MAAQIAPNGPGAPRQNNLQVEEKLYSHGCNYLLFNDSEIRPSTFSPPIGGSLSHCEASHAMRMMNQIGMTITAPSRK